MDEPQPAVGTRGRDEAWEAHPVLSGLLRLVIFTIPIAAALTATFVLRGLLPTPETRIGWWAWWIVLLGAALAVSLATERVARRLLPLAMLLKLSMLFPDHAPSRFRVARHSGSVRELREQLDAADPDEPIADRAGTVLSLVMALTAHDRKTRGHAERVRVFTDLLTEQLKLPEEDRHRLRWAALLHDIGKLSVEPEVLNKPDKLDAAEWEQIHTHPAEGARLAEPLIPWLAPWGDAIVQHHEWFDGSGYPSGLAGSQIGDGARIVSVADCYDTMTSARSYQRPKSTAAARRELVAGAGTQFDPVVVRAFLAISLPRLLWAVGPVSLLVHLPFLSYLQSVGQAGITGVAQTATVGALAGVTAVGMLGTPTQTVAAPSPRPPAVVVTHDGGTPASPPPATNGGGHTKGQHPDHGTKGGGAGSDGGGSASGGGSGSGGSGGAGSGGGGTGSGSGSGGGSGGGSGSGGGTGGGSGSGGGAGAGGGGSGSSGGDQTDDDAVATALGLISALRSDVSGSTASDDAIEDLTKRLDDATEKLDRDRVPDACDRINAFIVRVQHFEDDHHEPLDATLADDWTDRANDIGSTLSC
jgi:HD-GYP domain-containing protein (c-di-GMP phosphodiesterase class II)